MTEKLVKTLISVMALCAVFVLGIGLCVADTVLMQTYTFEDGTDGWQFSGQIGDFTPPLSSAEERLGLVCISIDARGGHCGNSPPYPPTLATGIGTASDCGEHGDILLPTLIHSAEVGQRTRYRISLHNVPPGVSVVVNDRLFLPQTGYCLPEVGAQDFHPVFTRVPNLSSQGYKRYVGHGS